MAKKKSKSRFARLRRYARRIRHRDNRLPLSVGVGLATSVLAPPAPGWMSALDAMKAGKAAAAASSFIRAWTGIYGIDGAEPIGINFSAFNPLDLSDAPAWKAMLYTALIARVVKGVTHTDPLSKVPVLKKFVKFS